MNISEINEEIRIEDFLQNEGFSPTHIRKAGKELWYCSPLRNENTPSFKVETIKNVWFDYATNQGGKLTELCVQLKKLSIKEVIYFFNNEYKGGFSTPIQRENHQKKINNSVTNEGNSQIIEEIFPVKNVKLWDYLRERKIDFDIAKRYLTEVHYQSNGKNWYALGFKCDKGGYELRSPISKRNINGKNISTIKNGSDKVKVFEGFFDFLSYASEHKRDYLNYDYIVLNSSAFLEGMYNNLDNKNENYLYQCLQNYSRIDTYFDNDQTGKTITFHMQEIFGQINDFSVLYANYNDYNQFCIEGRINKDFYADESAIFCKNRQIKQQEEQEIIFSKYSHFKI